MEQLCGDIELNSGKNESVKIATALWGQLQREFETSESGSDSI